MDISGKQYLFTTDFLIFLSDNVCWATTIPPPFYDLPPPVHRRTQQTLSDRKIKKISGKQVLFTTDLHLFTAYPTMKKSSEKNDYPIGFTAYPLDNVRKTVVYTSLDIRL